MVTSTGTAREVRCECGVTVTERELRLYPPPEGAPPTHWSRDHHHAPCGLQCARGGIRGEGDPNGRTRITVRGILDLRRFHGTMGRHVGKCPCAAPAGGQGER